MYAFKKNRNILQIYLYDINIYFQVKPLSGFRDHV